MLLTLYAEARLATRVETFPIEHVRLADSQFLSPQIPQTQLPALIGSPDGILTHMKPVDGQAMTFASSNVNLSHYEGLRLVPFNQLFECRYQIYFPLYAADEWTAKQAELAAAEKAQMELEANTVDKVFCGEQQSESDHFFSGADSWNGSDAGAHWRRAKGCFSYQVRMRDVRTLRLRGFDDPEPLVVTITGKTLPDVRLGSDGLAVVTLPSGLPAENSLLTLSSKGDSQTPRIVEIRLCK